MPRCASTAHGAPRACEPGTGRRTPLQQALDWSIPVSKLNYFALGYMLVSVRGNTSTLISQFGAACLSNYRPQRRNRFPACSALIFQYASPVKLRVGSRGLSFPPADQNSESRRYWLATCYHRGSSRAQACVVIGFGCSRPFAKHRGANRSSHGMSAAARRHIR